MNVDMVPFEKKGTLQDAMNIFSSPSCQISTVQVLDCPD